MTQVRGKAAAMVEGRLADLLGPLPLFPLHSCRICL